jgi:ABC-type spermidine/putrescine transport system permease subunit II
VYPRQQVRLRTRVGNWLLGTNAALVFGFIYLPVVILIIFSFNNTRSVALFTGFSTEWYTALANNEELLDAARNSLLVGLITTIVATIIGTLTVAAGSLSFQTRIAFDANHPIVTLNCDGHRIVLFFNRRVPF